MIVGSEESFPHYLEQRNYISHFGFKMAVDDNGTSCVVLPFEKRNLGNSLIGALHGGVVALALETAGYLALLQNEPPPRASHIGIAHTTYLTRTRPEVLWAHARIIRSGARFVRLEAKAFQKHGEIAHAMLTASRKTSD